MEGEHRKLDLHYMPDSGFMARGAPGPQRERPRDWLVWHFTHMDNIEAIAASGCLFPSSDVAPCRSVANDDVKDRRTYRVRPDDDYPASTVRDHVPFYIAAKSPMLYAVTSPGPQAHKAKSQDLVFMGAVLGDLIDSTLTWCISNGNASSGFTAFSRKLDQIGDFVDFDLLCQKMWYNTIDDPYRQGRRAAECLVLGRVPLQLVSVIVTRNDAELRRARQHLETVGGMRQYRAMRDIFYN